VLLCENMPKESRQKNIDSSHGRRNPYHDRNHNSREKHSSKNSTGVRISKDHYRLVIKSCESMLSDIRLQIDELCGQFQHKNTSRPLPTSSNAFSNCSTVRKSLEHRSFPREVSIMNRSSAESIASSGDRMPRLAPLDNNRMLSSPMRHERYFMNIASRMLRFLVIAA